MMSGIKGKNTLLKANWRVLVIWECAIKSRGRLTNEMIVKRSRKFLTGSVRILEIKGNHETKHYRLDG